MLKDIYVRNPDDPKYISGKIEETDLLTNLIDQLRIMFATNPGEVIANPDFGVNLSTMLFELEFNSEDIVKEINRQFFKFIFPYFGDVNVEFSAFVSDNGISKSLILDVYINTKLTFQIIS